jgi:translation elongation factor EF-G
MNKDNLDSQKQNEEIDIFDLFRLIKNALKNIYHRFLLLVHFLLRNALLILAVIVIGIVLGYFWKSSSQEYHQTQAMISANEEGTDYLYNKIDEVNFLLQKDNTKWAALLGDEELKGLSLEVKPVYLTQLLSNEEENYLDYIEESKLLEEEQKKELLQNKIRVHKVILKHPAEKEGSLLLEKIINQLKDNAYFKKLYQEKASFLADQVQANKEFIASLDRLIANYANSKDSPADAKIVVNGANFDFDGLISQRTELQKETQNLIKEKIQQEEFLRIIDLSMPQPLKQKSILQKNKMLLTPIILLVILFLGYLFFKIIAQAKSLKPKS